MQEKIPEKILQSLRESLKRLKATDLKEALEKIQNFIEH